jgi:hypothetical protein
MADTPPNDGAARPDDTAKLELPSLNPFKRRRSRRDPEPVEPVEPVEAPEAAGAPEAAAEPVTEPVPPPAPEAAVEPVTEPVPPPAAEPAHEPEPAVTPARDIEETRPFVAAPERTGTNGVYGEEPADEPASEPASEPGQRKATRPGRGLPSLPAPLAALLGGLVVGAFGVGLTWVSLTGCDAVRGTESCGGAGVLVVFVILVLMVLLGGLVLTLLHLKDARATSFLAVGVLFVVVLLTPQDALFSAWMFLVVPLVSAAAFVLAHWVTATFVEPQPEKGPAHDVR